MTASGSQSRDGPFRRKANPPRLNQGATSVVSLFVMSGGFAKRDLSVDKSLFNIN